MHTVHAYLELSRRGKGMEKKQKFVIENRYAPQIALASRSPKVNDMDYFCCWLLSATLLLLLLLLLAAIKTCMNSLSIPLKKSFAANKNTTKNNKCECKNNNDAATTANTYVLVCEIQ